jgi:UDP-perosamine 4-acetyltransferase
VADALLASGIPLIGFTDPDTNLHGTFVLGVPVLGDDAILTGYSTHVVSLANGLGGVGRAGQLDLRAQLQKRWVARGFKFNVVRHPQAIVSRHAESSGGTFFGAGSVVQPRSVIGEGAVINTSAIVEHDTTVGAWSHIAPGAVVCGGVAIGAYAFIGAGAVVRQGLRLGDRVVVAAGAVVVRDFEGPGTLVGAPARPMGKAK